MARNRKDRPVDKKDQKKPHEGKTFWGRTRSTKNVEPETFRDELNLNDENKETVGAVEQKNNKVSSDISSETNKTTENLADQPDGQKNKHLVAIEDDKNKVSPVKATENKTLELFVDNPDRNVDTQAKEITKDAKSENSQEMNLMDDYSEVEVSKKSREEADLGGIDSVESGKLEQVQFIEIKKDFIPFDQSKAVYVEIHRGNIFHYFIGGLLLSSKYIGNRAFSDIQNINEDFLIVANSGTYSANSDLVLLEVDLTGIDKEAIIVQDNYALLSIPLPVTRIKSILVQNDDIKKTIVKDALLFDGGFIPESLIAVKELELKQIFDFNPFKVVGKKGYSREINRFDRVLGLLAFLRNYDLLISERSKVYKSLPLHFFYAMQALDEGFGSEIIPKNTISEFYGYLFNENCPSDKSLLKWLFERVQRDDNFTDADILAFGNELKKANELSTGVRNALSLLSKNMDRKNGLKAIDELKSKAALPLYIFAFLRNYGNLNSIEVARRDVSYFYSTAFGEYAFALLGYFYGYKNLRNTDERLSSSSIAVNFIKGKAPIKFQLTTNFDYAVMEIVYQFVFNEKDGQAKDLLKVNHHLEEEKLTKLSYGNYPVYEKILYGKLYQLISFADPVEKLLDQLSFLPNEIPLVSTFGTFCFQARVRFVPYSVSNWGEGGLNPDRIVFLKRDLLNYILDNKDRIDMEEMQLRIQLEKKILAK